MANPTLMEWMILLGSSCARLLAVLAGSSTNLEAKFFMNDVNQQHPRLKNPTLSGFSDAISM